MNYSPLATTWAALDPTAQMLILTEASRLPIANKIKADNAPYAADIRVADASDVSACEQQMHRMTQHDLLIVLLTVDGFMNRGFRDAFSPFSKPAGFAGKYIFIRLDIPEAALLSGLNTDVKKVESIVERCRAFSGGKRVRVTAPGGTDITMRIDDQELVPYDARPLGGSAFLPPAEISEALIQTSANGIIVADITVGEIRFGPQLIDPLGIVDKAVAITVQDGRVTSITGGGIAKRLKDGLGQLDDALQVLVELGHGLSDIAPTGIIGVDESINGTCHFGIGNRNPYHVDVVVSGPIIEIID